MRTPSFVLTTALAMTACTKPNPAPAANDAVTTGNPAVAGVQDATAGAVGAVAATAS
ncbi:MAG: hypothetical protein ABI306_02285 [Caulobacteraceae bacterium]